MALKIEDTVKQKIKLEKKLERKLARWYALAIAEAEAQIRAGGIAIDISRRLQDELRETLYLHYGDAENTAIPDEIRKAKEDYMQELHEDIKERSETVINERRRKQFLIIYGSALRSLQKEAIRIQRDLPSESLRALSKEFRKRARARAKGTAVIVATTETNWVVEATRLEAEKIMAETLERSLRQVAEQSRTEEQLREGMIRAQKIIQGSEREGLKKKISTLAKQVEAVSPEEGAIIILATSIQRRKQWGTMRDGRVRQTHQEVDGVEIAEHEAFLVGASLMMYPGDDSLGADIEEIINCRCSVKYL